MDEANEHIHHRFTGLSRRFPRNGFNGLFRALPGDRAFLPPSFAEDSANLTPASGRQDHTALPSAAPVYAKGPGGKSAEASAKAESAIRPRECYRA